MTNNKTNKVEKLTIINAKQCLIVDFQKSDLHSNS